VSPPAAPGRQRLVSVIGAGRPTPEVYDQALAAGRLLARAGFGVVTGGLGGVMEAACRGAVEEGGLTVGILPTPEAAQANPWCRVVIPSGLGQARNVLVVLAGEGALAVGGGPGTLSELGHALKAGRPVEGLLSWELPGLSRHERAETAVAALLQRLESAATDPGPACGGKP
jgi:uncharacterized protein (TIGR00725 family)